MNVETLQLIISHCRSCNGEIIDKPKESQEGSNLAVCAGVLNSFRSAVKQDQSSQMHKPACRKKQQLLKWIFFYILDLNISSTQGKSPLALPCFSVL